MIGTLTPAFEPWDILKIPFPYHVRPALEYRPVLVVACGRLESAHGSDSHAPLETGSSSLLPERRPPVSLGL